MKTINELRPIENLVKRAYNRGQYRLIENLNKPFDPYNPELGYSWKFADAGGGKTLYNVVVAKLDKDNNDKLLQTTEYFIKMHEYGHIYLAHLDGIYEELDRKVASVLKIYRGELIDRINNECKIDFAEDLINRIIDDPVLNHSLHNIAMDFEVNSVILDLDCIETMQNGVTSILPKVEEEILKGIRDQEEVPDHIKKKIDELLDKMAKEAKIKFMHPSFYHLSDGSPFPLGLTYPEYLILIIKNMSQFVKMLVSISSGGNGDTSSVTDDALAQALGNGMTSLTDMMRQLGMIEDGQDGQGQPGQDQQGDQNSNSNGSASGNDTSNSGGFKENGKDALGKYVGKRDSNFMELSGGTHKDHRTTERDAADKSRELGQITAGGGAGCGSSGGSDGVRTVTKQDPVDDAIEEVINKTRSRVLKINFERSVMRNYNLGKIRSAIVPSITPKFSINTKPKIVYLIDISGSMDTVLIDRILATISRKMRSINRGLLYDIITWNTSMGEHIRNIKAGEKVEKIHSGGGTRLARGIQYFKENYKSDSILIVVSDFEDYLEEWNDVLKNMPKYTVYGFNYGRSNYNNNFTWAPNFIVKNFNRSYTD